jgi:hypothetical protein
MKRVFRSLSVLHAAALGACLAGAAASMPAAAQSSPTPPSAEAVERRLTSTGTLIESSSGARQIQSSGNAAAAEKRDRARSLHGEAAAALKAGDTLRSTKLLDEAARAMFEGVRLASPQQVTGSKEKADFDARLESTRALLDAQKRIADEKSAGPRAAELTQRIQALMDEAVQQANGGRVEEGRKTLDQAYLAAKAAIGGMRGGETVVRSLNFATKEDEYHYEIDRNDTHRMLVDVLLKEKRGTASVDAMVDESLKVAAKLRSEAEAQAGRKEHEAAVKTLEDSTRELVKAIRGAGVYIPG